MSRCAGAKSWPDAGLTRRSAGIRLTARKCRRGPGAARSAVTRIAGAEHFGRLLTLARMAIHTGRTHQIRVHLSAIGHPIVGDSLYGGVRRRVPGDLRAVTHLQRPFLHAARLVFTHPSESRRMEFVSELPEDLQRVLDELRETCVVARGLISERGPDPRATLRAIPDVHCFQRPRLRSRGRHAPPPQRPRTRSDDRAAPAVGGADSGRR